MTTLESIRQLCEERGITITKLERDLGYSQSSLSRAKAIPSDRILDIAEYFHVSTDRVIKGDDDGIALAMPSGTEIDYYKARDRIGRMLNEEKDRLMELTVEIDAVQFRISKLKKEYDDLLADEDLY